MGVSVYIDWQDYGIPTTTDGSTAIRIKNKIKENEKFILLATEEAIASKWCNWELGLDDAFKFPENIAIMPITDSDDDNFSGSEYTGLDGILIPHLRQALNVVRHANRHYKLN